MKKINWGEVEEAQNFTRICAGGYVCRVVKVEDDTQKEYLKIWCDPVEGEFKDFGTNAEQRTGQDWNYIRFYRSYKSTALNFFKAWLSALEKSNPGKFSANKFDSDESKMVGLRVGLVIADEEYLKQDGKKGLRTYVHKVLTPDEIRAGKFRVPDMKLLPPSAASASAAPEADPYDCPF